MEWMWKESGERISGRGTNNEDSKKGTEDEKRDSIATHVFSSNFLAVVKVVSYDCVCIFTF